MSGAELFPIVAKDASETGKPLREAVGTSLADVWQGLWGDKLASWRLKNAAKLNDALGKELAERGLALNLDKIPERFAYSWFEKASQEDEPEIQALFAKLLANAAEGNDEALKRRNIELISKMSPSDAKLLEYIAQVYEDWRHPHSSLAAPYITEYSQFWYEVERNVPDLDDTSLETLMAHRILEEEIDSRLDSSALTDLMRNFDGHSFSLYQTFNSGIITTSNLVLTATGKSLIDALFEKTE